MFGLAKAGRLQGLRVKAVGRMERWRMICAFAGTIYGKPIEELAQTKVSNGFMLLIKGIHRPEVDLRRLFLSPMRFSPYFSIHLMRPLNSPAPKHVIGNDRLDSSV